ncbi:MAG: hypothetical protein WD003_01765 [Candidatus Paceibacterota bacterium]
MVFPINVSKEGDSLLTHPPGRNSPQQKFEHSTIEELYHRGSPQKPCGGEMHIVKEPVKNYIARECSFCSLTIRFPYSISSYGALRKYCSENEVRVGGRWRGCF